MKILEKILKETRQAKQDSLINKKRTGDYRIGLSKAEDIIIDVINDYTSDVSKSVAKEYAMFCVRCDREGIPLLELDDYIGLNYQNNEDSKSRNNRG